MILSQAPQTKAPPFIPFIADTIRVVAQYIPDDLWKFFTIAAGYRDEMNLLFPGVRAFMSHGYRSDDVTPMYERCIHAGLLRQGQISRCRKNTEGMNKRHAVDSRLGPSKTVDILESMFSQGFGYTSSSFPKGKDEPASIDIRLNDGGQPRMMDPRQKGGFIDG
jgi:hypothetical protein